MRFLNTIGGGVVTKIDGKIVYVEEDGFEVPVMAKDVVVVMPAGHQPDAKGAKLMFDQKAFDHGRNDSRDIPKTAAATPTAAPAPTAEPELPVVETDRGEEINLTLGFEPDNIKELSKSKINLVLVNDSNYFLSFTLLTRDFEAKAWAPVYQGEVAPNELIDLATFTQENIAQMERVVFQAIAYKKGKPFQVKSPITISKKIDTTKFFKVHCFRPGIYFDTPVVELPLYSERPQPLPSQPHQSHQKHSRL